MFRKVRIHLSPLLSAYARWIASLIKDESQPLSYYSSEKSAHVPDHGTSHVVVLDKDGNAVSTTSTINQ